MDERCATGWGEKDFELTIPLGMDRKPVRKRPAPEPVKKEYSEKWFAIIEWIGVLAMFLLAGWVQ